MKETIAAAAATSLAAVSSLLSSFMPSPHAAAPFLAIAAFPTELLHASTAPYTKQETPPEAKAVPSGPDAVLPLIDAYAKEYGVSAFAMQHLVSCETAGTFDPTIQSGHRYNFEDARRGIRIGEQERSFGLAQIHLPDNPTITLEQAKDPHFSLRFIASSLAKGQTWRWSCMKIYP